MSDCAEWVGYYPLGAFASARPVTVIDSDFPAHLVPQHSPGSPTFGPGLEDRRPAVSAIVPVYNSQDSVGELTTRLCQVLESAASEFEIIFVNDGSRDASWRVLRELVACNPRLRAIALLRNYGQHNALLAGIRAARYAVLLTMDDDLQHPPEEIPKLLRKLSEGHDVVYGTPSGEDHALWRTLASRVTKLALQSTMGIDTASKVSAFRVFRAQIREAFAAFQGPYVCIDVLLTWGTTRFAAVDVAHAPRKHGDSNYSFRMLCTHALNMVTGFSTLPLRIASVVGFLATFLGLALFIYVVGRSAVSGGVVPGFPFLASAVTLFSGVQLFTLGVIGEYLARMHFRLMDRPGYAVGERLPAVPERSAERRQPPHA